MNNMSTVQYMESTTVFPHVLLLAEGRLRRPRRVPVVRLRADDQVRDGPRHGVGARDGHLARQGQRGEAQGGRRGHQEAQGHHHGQVDRGVGGKESKKQPFFFGPRPTF